MNHQTYASRTQTSEQVAQSSDALIREITDPRLAILVSSIDQARHQGDPLHRIDYLYLFLATVGISVLLILIGVQL